MARKSKLKRKLPSFEDELLTEANPQQQRQRDMMDTDGQAASEMPSVLANVGPPPGSRKQKLSGKFKDSESKRSEIGTKPNASVTANSNCEPKYGDEAYVDPFPSALRCPLEPDETKHQVVWWHCIGHYLELRTEESLISTLVKWGKTERGMMKDQPPFRLEAVRRICKEKKVPLYLALSLRRHHIKNHHRNKRMPELRLGTEEDIRESARIFEDCVAEFLSSQGVAYWTEEEQKANAKANRTKGEFQPPSPDFMLKKQVRVKRFVYGNNNASKLVSHERSICWVEAKMFYGASTIPHDMRSAVGGLLASAHKYVRAFGPGAMVFKDGCGDRLARELADLGVIALDCGSFETVKLEAVVEHQMTWCADKKGQILP